MSARWQLRPLLLIRVTGLPLSTLDGLAMTEAPAIVARLDALEEEMVAARASAIALLHSLVGGCEDAASRRWALTVKRRLFNAKALRPRDLEGTPDSAPSPLAPRLEQIHAQERRHALLTLALGQALERERAQISVRLCARVDHPRLVGGILLSSRDHCEVAQGLAALTSQDPHTAARAIREATIARYLLRATTRTTPFGSFAAAALLPIDSEGTPKSEAESPTWVRTPQLNLGILGGHILPELNAEALSRLPLRPTPLRKMVAQPSPHILFPRYLPGSLDTADSPTCRWSRVPLNLPIVQLLDAVDGATAAQAIAALATPERDAAVWKRALEALLAAGLVERIFPACSPTAAGLQDMATAVETLGDRGCGRRLRILGAALQRHAEAPVARRPALVQEIADAAGTAQLRGCVLEDCSVQGLDVSQLPLTIERLAAELEPVAALARSCATDRQHQIIAEEFCARFGVDGRCDDVAGFVTSLLQDTALCGRLRHLDAPSPWLDARLGRAIEAAADEPGEPLDLDPALFLELPGADYPCSIAAFVQLAVRRERHAATPNLEVEHIVLNGFQSGRDKYLSRYLCDPAVPRDRLSTIRDSFATDEGPTPVGIHLGMGLNFQLHPPLTPWTLDAPIEVSRPGDLQLLSLAQLVSTFDPQTSQLRLYAPHLKREVEPIHLGFVRDQLLPDPLLVIRALSPRIRDETIAERAALYTTLDARTLMTGRGLRRFRPRLCSGPVVVERARWAVPVAAVPLKAERESHAPYFARLERWRRSLGLPRRGFARRLSASTYLRDLARSQQYLDWHNPLVLGNLRRLVGDQPDAWLVITELLPAPEQAHLELDGELHCAELVVQLDWKPQ